MEILLVVFAVLAVALVFRLLAGQLDDGRVRRHIEEQGGHLIEKRWNPFGKGWLGEKNARIYEVRYRDRDGNIRRATCKTSALAGVYFTEDRVVSGSQAERDPLVEENRRLRREIERLKRERGE